MAGRRSSWYTGSGTLDGTSPSIEGGQLQGYLGSDANTSGYGQGNSGLGTSIWSGYSPGNASQSSQAYPSHSQQQQYHQHHQAMQQQQHLNSAGNNNHVRPHVQASYGSMPTTTSYLQLSPQHHFQPSSQQQQMQAQPQMHKRPSNTHLQTTYAQQQHGLRGPGSPNTPSTAMSLSPALRSGNPGGSDPFGMAQHQPYSPSSSTMAGSSSSAQQHSHHNQQQQQQQSSSNAGLGMPRNLLPAAMLSGPPASAPPTASGTSPHHQPFQQQQTGSASYVGNRAALTVSTSPTVGGSYSSTIAPSSPAYQIAGGAAGGTSASMTPVGGGAASYSRAFSSYDSASYNPSGGPSNMISSPTLGTSSSPNPFGSFAAPVGSGNHHNTSAHRPSLQPSQSSSSTSASSASVDQHYLGGVVQQQSGQSSQAHPSQQHQHYYPSSTTGGMSSPYLGDGNNGGLDRQRGSYSPSHYAISGGAAGNPGQMGAYGQSAKPTSSPYTGTPFHLHSPRQQPPLSSSSVGSGSSYFASGGGLTHANNPSLSGQAASNYQGYASNGASTASQLSPSYSRQTHQPYNPAHSPHASSGISAHRQRPSVSSTASGSTSQSHTYQVRSQHGQQRRSRSAGSAFRRVREHNDCKGAQPTFEGRRADPEGGSVSPLKALTTQLSQTYHLVNPTFRYEFSLNPRRVLTKPSKPAGNDGYDNEDSDYILYVNDVLGSDGNKYLILDVLGQGTFGQVVKCQNMKTHEIVGVKVIKNKPAYYQQSMMEITILEMLNQTYDPEDKHHILRLKDTFVHCRHLCLVFELLSSNLYELIKQNAFRGLSTSLVRVFTEQLLDALCVLKDARLIHCDLKPENILLKTLQSPDIKVIDFGSACHERQTVYTYIQSRFYRSPEVLLGLPYSTSIDMWSLGCICVELFLGLPLFPGTSEFNQVTRIVEMLGLPPTYMLETGKQVHHFFNVFHDEYGRKSWRLKSLEEYERDHPNAKEQPSKKFFAANTLPDIVKTYPNQRKGLKQADLDREMQNRLSFIDFVQGLLNLNPMERWTPQQARMHPFVLNEPLRQPYVPQMGLSSSTSGRQSQHGSATAAGNDRPYGGLPPAPAGTSTKAYQDAAAYQQQLNQHQAHVAAASANAYRQAQSTNPYAPQPSEISPKQSMPPAHQLQQQQHFAVPRLPPSATSSGQARQGAQNLSLQAVQQPQQIPSIAHHSPSSSLSYSNSALRNSSSGPLSPLVPTNPPAAHHYASRGRSGTFSQLDVPPALQKLGLDLSSFKAIGTPQLRRDDQRAAWERRHGADPNALDRRRSLKQANPHLEHLESFAQYGHPQTGYYYHGPPSGAGLGGMQMQMQHQQQPFSVIIDPGMPQAAAAASSVKVPPQAYAGAPGTTRYAVPPQSMGPLTHPAAAAGVGLGGGSQYESFDQYDIRDGLNTMMHQPLVPTSSSSSQQQQQSRSQHTSGHVPPMAYYGAPPPPPSSSSSQLSMYGGQGQQGHPSAQGIGYPGESSAMQQADALMNGYMPTTTTTGGKQRKSDAQLWP